jgi:hypothetical protein
MGLRSRFQIGNPRTRRQTDTKPRPSELERGTLWSEVDAMRLGRPLKSPSLRKERDRLAIRQQSGKVLQRPTRETATGGASRFVSGTLIQSRENLTMGSSSKRGGYTVNTVAQRPLV